MNLFSKITLLLGLSLRTIAAFGADSDQPPRRVEQFEVTDTDRIPYGGRVIVGCVIDSNGTPTNVQVLICPRADIFAPAIEGVIKSRYQPGYKDGRPTPMVFSTAVNFFGRFPSDAVARPWGGANDRTVSNLPPEFRYRFPPSAKMVGPGVYPYDLLIKGKKGSASIAFVVDPSGRTRRMMVAEATDPEFGAATVAMLATWKFYPAINKDDKPCWCVRRMKQVFDVDDEDFGINGSGLRVLRELKETPCPIIANVSELDAPLAARYRSPVAVPEAMVIAKTPGQAVIRIVVDRAGYAQFPRVISASSEDFAWAAATAVGQWHFSTPMKHGQPVDVFLDIPVGFRAQ